MLTSSRKAIYNLNFEIREMSKTFLESAAAVPQVQGRVQELSDDGLSLIQYHTMENTKLMQQPIEKPFSQLLGRISQSSNPVLMLLSQFIEFYEVHNLATFVTTEIL